MNRHEANDKEAELLWLREQYELLRESAGSEAGPEPQSGAKAPEIRPEDPEN